jgi:hypothetical protein
VILVSTPSALNGFLRIRVTVCMVSLVRYLCLVRCVKI